MVDPDPTIEGPDLQTKIRITKSKIRISKTKIRISKTKIRGSQGEKVPEGRMRERTEGYKGQRQGEG
jgi:hypothetical protein